MNKTINNISDDSQSESSLGQFVLQKKKKRWVGRLFFILTLIAVSFLSYYLFFAQKVDGYQFVVPVKMDLEERVELTGKIEANARIDLYFKTTGQIADIKINVGESLKKGDIMAFLNNKDEELALKRAQVNYDAQVANLNQKLAGNTNERIAIAQAQLNQSIAQTEFVSVELENKKSDLELIKKKHAEDIELALLKLAESERNLIFIEKNNQKISDIDLQSVVVAKENLYSQLFSSSGIIQQSLINIKSLVVNDGYSLIGSDYYRFNHKIIYSSLQNYLVLKKDFDVFFDTLNSLEELTFEALFDLSDQVLEIMSRITIIQKNVSDMFSNTVSSSTLSETQLTNFKNLMLSDLNSILASQQALYSKNSNLTSVQLTVGSNFDQTVNSLAVAKNAHEQQIQSVNQMKIDHQLDLNSRESAILMAKANLEVQKASQKIAEESLLELKSPPRSVDIAFLKTQVAAALIELSMRKEDFERTVLRAPIDGVLSRKFVEIGQEYFSAKPAFEMISSEKLMIKADIAEVDIGKIRIDDKVEIILDAIGGQDMFFGFVSRIDPVETLISDVVYYKSEVLVDSNDPRIKPGMTANLSIILNRKEGVITVPDRAVGRRADGQRFVRKLIDGVVEEFDVVVGIRDLDGNLEIVSGLKEGEEIILRTLAK